MIKKVQKQKEKELLCQKYENHIKEKLEKEKDSLSAHKAATETEKDIIVDFENNKKSR